MCRGFGRPKAFGGQDDRSLCLAAIPIQVGKTGIIGEGIAGELQPECGMLADRLRAVGTDTNAPGLTLWRFARSEGPTGQDREIYAPGSRTDRKRIRSAPASRAASASVWQAM